MRQLTKWSCIVHRNSHSTSSTTRDKVCGKWLIWWTLHLVCVSIHLECWLDKARVEIVTWAAMGVARQQQFSYNLVSKFWLCEHDWCGLIQFAFDAHQVNANSIRIQTESSVKGPLVRNELIWLFLSLHVGSPVLAVSRIWQDCMYSTSSYCLHLSCQACQLWDP